MAGYTKLFSSIVTSTIWREGKETKIMWVTMLALSDKDGIVEGSIPGLADMARLTVEEARTAIEILSAPDPDSRSKIEEGRRIIPIDGGWLLVNHAKYRDLMSVEERREYLRIKQAEFREKRKQMSTPVNNGNGASTKSTHTAPAPSPSPKASDTEGAVAPRVFSIPTALEVETYSRSIGYPLDGQGWCDSYAQKGWMVGKSKMKDWKAAVRNWKTNGYHLGNGTGQRPLRGPRDDPDNPLGPKLHFA